MHASLPSRVNRDILAMSALLPLYPRKPTFIVRDGMSQRCQQETHAPQQTASYSITSSAIASSVFGTARPSALAVLRLMTHSNLVGCCTGKSAGLGPPRIRGRYEAVASKRYA